jgi:hypothetical protein
MVTTGVPILSTDGGDEIRNECAAVLAARPRPPSESDLIYAR